MARLLTNKEINQKSFEVLSKESGKYYLQNY
jgi:hypothetical protein